MTRRGYTCFRIPRYGESRRDGDRWVWTWVPAHLVCFSVPWIHPRLRRRMATRLDEQRQSG